MRLIFCLLIFYLVLLIHFMIQVHSYAFCELPVSVDGIVVVTGQAGRVQSGLTLLNQYTCPLFISGVGAPVKKNDLISDAALAERIILGHQAKNTQENGKEISEWVQTFNLKSIILITHNYHMPRVLVYLKKLPPIKIYPHIISPPLTTWRFVLEMHKYYYALLQNLALIA